MSDKRYQVFVSSTYADLKEERSNVIQALMEMDCIPTGMELFPAMDKQQWAFIRKVIDDSDYYLLIIGGRYGSLTPDGISYTEQEFDYAVERGLKVVALIHGEPNKIPFGKSEPDPKVRAQLDAFKGKVMDGRLVKFWTKAEELPGLVALSLTKTIKAFPAEGWVRATSTPSSELLSEINDRRKSNAALQEKETQRAEAPQTNIENLAGLDAPHEFHGTYRFGSPSSERTMSAELAWADLFVRVAPYLLAYPRDSVVQDKVGRILMEKAGKAGSYPRINDEDFQTMRIQFEALGLIQISYTKDTGGGMGLFWVLTPKGKRTLIKLRAIRSPTVAGAT